MNIDDVREFGGDPAGRDEIKEIKQQILKRYVSPWVSIEGAASHSFSHGLQEVPHLTSVLEATDAQGTGRVVASSVTVTSTVTIVSVTNNGSARYFQVRAF